MDTREKIINAFLEEVSFKGLAAVRVSVICKKLAIERKLFYYYFQDKYDLLCTIYRQDLLTSFSKEQTDKSNWQEHAQKLLHLYKQRGRFYPISILEDDGKWTKLFKVHMKHLFLNLFVELSAKAETNVFFYAEFYANGWVGLVEKWIKSIFEVSEEEIIKQFNSLIRFTKEYIYNWH